MNRFTKIIFTVGPATESVDCLEKMIRAGANICRLNMAHADHEWTRLVIARLRKACVAAGKEIPVMMDVKGPEIRTGDIEAGDQELKVGQEIELVAENWPESCSTSNRLRVSVNYPGITQDLKSGDTVLVDSGLIRLEVTHVDTKSVSAEVKIPGMLGNRRHINLPGVSVRLPSLTEKDLADIEVGVQCGVEYYALSFVRTADDLRQLRKHLEEQGSQARIIAKIEDQSALDKLQSITRASDGVMVARGDLGIECPYETLPQVQKRAVRTCINHGRPVIVATHMLESMIENPIPTRAEVTDVANAVLEQSDGIMLSGETTTGAYPVESVQTMDRIATETEKHLPLDYNKQRILANPRIKMLRSAALLAQELHGGILVFSHTGNLPRIVSSLRPNNCPIYAFTNNSLTHHQLQLFWGVEPYFMEFPEKSEPAIADAVNLLCERRRIDADQWLVVVTNVLTPTGAVESIQMRQPKNISQ